MFPSRSLVSFALLSAAFSFVVVPCSFTTATAWAQNPPNPPAPVTKSFSVKEGARNTYQVVGAKSVIVTNNGPNTIYAYVEYPGGFGTEARTLAAGESYTFHAGVEVLFEKLHIDLDDDHDPNTQLAAKGEYTYQL